MNAWCINVKAESKTIVSGLDSEQISSLTSLWTRPRDWALTKIPPRSRKQALKVTHHVQLCKRKIWGSIFLWAVQELTEELSRFPETPLGNHQGRDVFRSPVPPTRRWSSKIFQIGVNNLSKVERSGSVFRSPDEDSTSMEKGALETHP